MKFQPCLTLLKRCGFWDEGEQRLCLQKSGLRLGEVARICTALETHAELCHVAALLASVWSPYDTKADSSSWNNEWSPPSGDRSRLMCASPGCVFLVNSRAELGGYCCIACSEGGDHGPRCERVPAPK